MSIIPERGIGVLEVVAAILLTSVGIMAMLTLQSTGWKTAARADYLGRAAGILYKELETNEALIMNPVNAIPASSTRTVYASGQGSAVADAGDARFTVQTAITSVGTNIWRVTVTVSWPPLNNTGISENLVVTRQQRFSF